MCPFAAEVNTDVHRFAASYDLRDARDPANHRLPRSPWKRRIPRRNPLLRAVFEFSCVCVRFRRTNRGRKAKKKTQGGAGGRKSVYRRYIFFLFYYSPFCPSNFITRYKWFSEEVVDEDGWVALFDSICSRFPSCIPL